MTLNDRMSYLSTAESFASKTTFNQPKVTTGDERRTYWRSDVSVRHSVFLDYSKPFFEIEASHNHDL
jgi:hypothetical protein